MPANNPGRVVPRPVIADRPPAVQTNTHWTLLRTARILYLNPGRLSVRQEFRHVRRVALRTYTRAAVVAGRPLTQDLREPGFVLDLFMQDRQRKVVGTVILAGGVVTDGGIAADSAPFTAAQHLPQGLTVS